MHKNQRNNLRFALFISYDGTLYHGWQIQPNGVSVEGKIEQCLSVLLRRPIDIVGAGRTDTGVHARMMCAHFDIPDDMAVPDVEQLQYRLNRMLPKDICINRVNRVADDFHARFSALSRTYHYYVHTSKNPFLRHYSCELHYPLDFDLMNKAARVIMQYNDFGAFCKSHTDVKTTLCSVSNARWVQTAEDAYYFEITANRFLRNMVRAIVGTLIDVGRHRITIEQLHSIIQGKSRSDAGESMPANALFLEYIEY